MGLAIIQRSSLIESDESVESQRNKDALDTCDACDTPSVGVPVSRLMRLTIMCDSCVTNKMCGTAQISTQSQFGLL